MSVVMLVARWGLQGSLRRMRQIFQLHEGALAGSAYAGVKPVVCLLGFGFVASFPRHGDDLGVESAVAFVGQSGHALFPQAWP